MITYMKKYEAMNCFIPMQKCEFLRMCHAIGIHGGKKESHYEVLCREAEKGNEKAKNLLSKIRRVEQ